MDDPIWGDTFGEKRDPAKDADDLFVDAKRSFEGGVNDDTKLMYHIPKKFRQKAKWFWTVALSDFMKFLKRMISGRS